MKNIIIKVCGMRDSDNIRAVAALGVDLMGFIFYPKSPRFVKMISSMAGLIPDYSLERINSNNSGKEFKVENSPKRVGVFVDDMPQNIVTRVYNYDLDYIQLHGNEPRTTIENLKATIDPDIKPGIKIIKAISVHEQSDIDKYKEYEGLVDYFLFDTKCKTVGGSGEHFDWTVLDHYDGATPFLLSGGIGPDDAERIRAYNHPKFVGIDLNSQFEDEPAMKNIEKLKTFIKAIRHE